jgi:undecaprenyl-phosphate 4-deoxy-4-formamido-L-arabinose transferase
MTQDAFISVVIPQYKSEEIIPLLYKRLVGALEGINGGFEVIIVCDCSPDGSWAKLSEISRKDPRIKPILLRKNVGMDGALMAGFNHVRGQYVVVMDDDLQHAPEDIPKLIEEIEKGCDVVYANFAVKRQSLIKNIGSWFNGKAAQLMIGKPGRLYLSAFKIIRGEVVRELILYDGPYPYVDGLIFQTTESICQITLTHHERAAGAGNYNLYRSFMIWLNLFTGYSILPLRAASYFGLFLSFVSAGMGLLLLCWKLFYGEAPEGWTSTMLVIIFVGGVQLLSMGMLGEYLGRTYMRVNRKPQFAIKEKLNIE